MDEDKFALVEKIIKDVDNVMIKNAELYAFDIVPVEENFRNKSPVLHLENCLGLESWCVKHVYMYCYSELTDKYFAKPKRKAMKPSSVNCERLTRLLNLTLLINPELSSFWNKRREMVLKSFLEKANELRFAKLVLSRKPKCNDAYSYRRWLLDLILKDETLQSNIINNLANEELHICELASDKSPNNYHSWNHRIWIVNKLKTIKNFDLNFLYIKEYDFSERWTAKHVSDYSCFHYRQFCIRNIISVDSNTWHSFDSTVNSNFRKMFVRTLFNNFSNDMNVKASEEDLSLYTEENLVNLLLCYNANKSCSCYVDSVLVCRKLEVLFHELVLNNELLRFYKYHETMWYHRRFIVHEVLALMYEHFGVVRQDGVLIKAKCGLCNSESRQKHAKIVRYDSDRIYSSILFSALKNIEKNFIEERQKDGDNYACRHEKYLRFVEGLNNVM